MCNFFLLSSTIIHDFSTRSLLPLTTIAPLCGTCRFSVGTRRRSIFTRTQLGKLFQESYKELPVYTGTLTNLGNFKTLYFKDNKLNVRKVRNITKYRAFRIEKVAGKASVRVKHYMHSDAWLGLTATGGAHVDATPHTIFRFGAPGFENMPPFELKTVDPTVIALIEKRHIATRPRLENAFALGKKRVSATHMMYLQCATIARVVREPRQQSGAKGVTAETRSCRIQPIPINCGVGFSANTTFGDKTLDVDVYGEASLALTLKKCCVVLLGTSPSCGLG